MLEFVTTAQLVIKLTNQALPSPITGILLVYFYGVFHFALLCFGTMIILKKG
jgi:hypothetical protein